MSRACSGPLSAMRDTGFHRLSLKVRSLNPLTSILFPDSVVFFHAFVHVYLKSDTASPALVNLLLGGSRSISQTFPRPIFAIVKCSECRLSNVDSTPGTVETSQITTEMLGKRIVPLDSPWTRP